MITFIKAIIGSSLFLVLIVALISVYLVMADLFVKNSNPNSQYTYSLDFQEASEIEAQEATLKDMKNFIGFYHYSNGNYPEHISIIKKSLCSGIEPDKYHYYPETGVVTLKNH